MEDVVLERERMDGVGDNVVGWREVASLLLSALLIASCNKVESVDVAHLK